jgi:hypothetical protein
MASSYATPSPTAVPPPHGGILQAPRGKGDELPDEAHPSGEQLAAASEMPPRPPRMI